VGISEDLKAALCPKPCRRGPITMSQHRLLLDGSVEVTGELPPPLCDGCPERDNPEAPIRHIEVLHGFPPGGGVWGVQDIENAVRINVQYDDAP
jgi:hypothetical protein